jgi:putative FmdB family regulatory protein
MPIFEYRCSKCGHVTAFLEKADSSNPHVCEKCGSEKTDKMFSTFATKTAKGTSASCPTGTCPLS